MVQAIQVLRFHLLELEKVSKKNLNLNYPPRTLLKISVAKIFDISVQKCAEETCKSLH